MYDVAVPSPITQRLSVDSVEHTTCLNAFDISTNVYVFMRLYVINVKKDHHNVLQNLFMTTDNNIP